MSARERILGAVRHHLGRSQGGAVPPPPPVPQFGKSEPDTAARVQQFTARLRLVGGHVHDGAADGGLAAVRDLLAQYAPAVLTRSDSPLVAALVAQLPAYGWLPIAPSKPQLFGSELGLTAAQWAIAETGTLVLDMAQERHRLASLLPPVHIALLPKARILANLGEALQALPNPLPPTITFVTGPSRTADIELQLVVGVHGPRELHVVLV